MNLKSPFPWFGGKSRVADLVWDRFGEVMNYVEPFFGSGAVLLGRPHEAKTETINDLDCMVANFWRALQHDPHAVAYHADNPVNEADQHARHLWLCSQADFRETMKVDPEFYDVKIAGWWVWGQCIWIGAGWCAKQLPHLGTAGTGVHRKRLHLGNAGKACLTELPRKRPMLGGHGHGVGIHSDRGDDLAEYLRALAERLREVRVCCGDWSRVCGPSVTFKHGITGVFLDPPYTDEAGRAPDLYSEDSGTIGNDVRAWALEWGSHRDMRIALCGYEGEHDMPESWECVAWKAAGAYGSQSDDGGRGRANSERERIWFSPACIRLQSSLF